MGIESRDYARDGSYTASLGAWGMDFTPVVKYLIIANVVVFVLQIVVTRPGGAPIPGIERVWREADESDVDADAEADPRGRRKDELTPDQRRVREEQARKLREIMREQFGQLRGQPISVVQEWFELNPRKTVQQGQIWRLVTCAFCHHPYDYWHILFNMVLLGWFGQRLERMYGSTEFLLFYLAAAVWASVAYVGLAYYTGDHAPAIGASGAVMGVMILYVIFYPFEQFLLFWFIPVPLWILLGVYIVSDLHPVLLALGRRQMFTGVAHAAHLGGLAFGFLYWRFGWRLEPIYDRLRHSAPVPKSRGLRKAVILPFPQPQDDLSDRVDEILRKITEHGKDSLTDEERDILIEASARYRGSK